MHIRYLAAIALLVVGVGAFAPACVAMGDSTLPDEPEEPGPNMTPAEPEPVGEAAQALEYCECSTVSDWCPGGKHCRVGIIPCIRTPRFCGGTLLDPCNGWCVN